MGTDSMPYKITGMLKDVPENSHLSFDILASYVSFFQAHAHIARLIMILLIQIFGIIYN